MLRCCDGSLYTGYTTNIKKRLKTHESKKGSKYVRSKLPIEIVYQEEFLTKSDALKRECEIKSLTREEKIKLLEESSNSLI